MLSHFSFTFSPIFFLPSLSLARSLARSLFCVSKRGSFTPAESSPWE